MQTKIKGVIFFLLFVLITLFFGNLSTFAQNNLSTTTAENLSGKRLEFVLGLMAKIKPLQISGFSGELNLTIPSGAFDQSTKGEIIKLDEDIPATSTLKRISDIYQIDFKKANITDNAKPYTIKLSYDQPSNFYKKIYFFDKNANLWRPLPSVENPQNRTVEAKSFFSFSRVAIFENQKFMTTGYATWYSHKGGLYAASPDFPKGSILQVINLENNKSVTVEVNDFGPDRAVYPDRVIDLDKIAYAKLSSIRGGKIKVHIEPIHIVGEEVKQPVKNTKTDFTINATCALAMNENSGQIVYEQNIDKAMPLASLTKIIAIKVFLDTKPNLQKVVTYKKQDEEYNYKYVDEKWESASLKVSEGETMTVENLIYAALVGSANNAVESLVRVSGYSRDVFIQKMNALVEKWGAENTYFLEPTGLSPQNVSSCRDYAIITKEAFKEKLIEKVSKTAEYDFDTINTKKHHHLKNTNNLVKATNYEVIGSKTGFLNEADHCLMTRVKSKTGNNLIAVLFGASSKASMLSEMKKLLDYGLGKIK